ncbi:MAG TPA: hypothetical protein DCE42_14070 [Myxococcales bacterium]|nr:hypothetical protein [Deltaproteobacteria bacterium]MBU52857.1 hypothetical protein [Deltaproteobacteria bacterium]HAA55885.1 hypothetical protein [Myxococcales bacterium]
MMRMMCFTTKAVMTRYSGLQDQLMALCMKLQPFERQPSSQCNRIFPGCKPKEKWEEEITKTLTRRACDC